MNLSKLNSSSKIFVAGHQGLVGSALMRQLREKGYENLLTKTRKELNLLDQHAVSAFIKEAKPDCIFLAAAKVGGIHANNIYPADFIYQNLLIETNLIHAAYSAQVSQLVFLGSSCIYPRECPQPIKEEYLLTGPLEPTNEPYAIAKIAGIKLCESYNRQYGTQYLSVMPTNLYGPHDNFDLQNSHVLPALLRKMHEAKNRGDKEVVVWGTGTPRREFLFVDDLADACIYLAEKGVVGGPINIGVGEDVSIRELAEIIRQQVGFQGGLTFDTSKPDGTPRKLLDVSRLAGHGWRAQTSLEKGIALTYQWFLQHQQDARI